LDLIWWVKQQDISKLYKLGGIQHCLKWDGIKLPNLSPTFVKLYGMKSEINIYQTINLEGPECTPLCCFYPAKRTRKLLCWPFLY